MSALRTGSLTLQNRGAMHSVNIQLTQWCTWMRAASRSPRTIDARRQIVQQFARYAGPDQALYGTWEPVAEWLANDRFSAGTRQAYQAGLRAWFRWLIENEVRPDNPVDRLASVRVPRRTPRPVTTDELGLALASKRFYKRTRTMILLEAYQGLRAHEVAKFRGEQICSGAVVITGKGGVTAELPLHPLIAQEAAHYPPRGFWFPSPDDPSRPITRSNASRVVSRALRRAGVDATGHQLRHWFGTEALRSSGGNLRTAQELLRHASPATTAIYTLVDDGLRRAAMYALPVPTVVDLDEAA